MPPELLKGAEALRWEAGADVYAFGLLLCQLWALQPPFRELLRGCATDGARLARLIPFVVEEQGRPPQPEAMPASLRQLMTRCWAQQPADRPTSKELVAELLPKEAADGWGAAAVWAAAPAPPSNV